MQVTKIETTKKLKMLDLQMDVLKTSKKKYTITTTEVAELPSDARCVFEISITYDLGYSSVGSNAFLLYILSLNRR